MAWQKKHKKRPFSGKRKVNNTSEAVMYRLHMLIFIRPNRKRLQISGMRIGEMLMEQRKRRQSKYYGEDIQTG